MLVTDLPNEVLFQIIGNLDDAFEFMRIARVCKKLQTLVKSMVLIVSDSSTRSRLFNSISDEFIQLRISGSSQFRSHWRKTFEKFQYFIFEYHSVELQAVLAEYICLIADLKANPRSKIDVIYMNKIAATISRTTVFDPRTFIPEKLGQVANTLYFEDSDQGIYSPMSNGLEPEALLLMGNCYHFDTIEELPQLYIYANERHFFQIISPSLKRIDGITNVNDKLPRLPTLSNFLKLSDIPNLRMLTGIGIESGMNLHLFERFRNLTELHLDSVFTGNLTLNVMEPAHVTLPSLEKLKISGNSISLSDISFPKLKILDITIRGSTERSFSSTLHLDNLDTPSLQELYISSSNISDAPLYILDQLDFVTIKVLCIYSSSLSMFPKLAHYEFPNLEEVKIGTFYVSNADCDPQPFQFNAPKLKLLNTKNLEIYNQVLFDSGLTYPTLESLLLQLKVHPEAQGYTFSKDHFPNLKHLDIGYFNRFGRLVSNNVSLKLDLPKLKSLTTKKELFEKIESSTDLRNIDLEIINVAPHRYT